MQVTYIGLTMREGTAQCSSFYLATLSPHHPATYLDTPLPYVYESQCYNTQYLNLLPSVLRTLPRSHLYPPGTMENEWGE